MQKGILLIRIMVGIIFTAHGIQKVASGFSMPIELVTGLGFPAFIGIILALGELLGGIALIVGFLTNYAALCIAIIMVGALVFVHLSQGFFNSEFPLLLLVASISIMLSYDWKKIFEPY